MITILEDYNYGESSMMISEKTMEDDNAKKNLRKQLLKIKK